MTYIYSSTLAALVLPPSLIRTCVPTRPEPKIFIHIWWLVSASCFYYVISPRTYPLEFSDFFVTKSKFILIFFVRFLTRVFAQIFSQTWADAGRKGSCIFFCFGFCFSWGAKLRWHFSAYLFSGDPSMDGNSCRQSFVDGILWSSGFGMEL